MTEQFEKSQSLTKELTEARKTSSKLRAHLEDARQENKRQFDECQKHLEELNNKKMAIVKEEESKKHERDSLVAANVQLANLRAQLEKATDAKVNKKMNSRLKVSPI